MDLQVELKLAVEFAPFSNGMRAMLTAVALWYVSHSC